MPVISSVFWGENYWLPCEIPGDLYPVPTSHYKCNSGRVVSRQASLSDNWETLPACTRCAKMFYGSKKRARGGTAGEQQAGHLTLA